MTAAELSAPATGYADVNGLHMYYEVHGNDFLTTLSASTADTRGWSDEQLAAISAPVLLVLGDRDFTTIGHGALMQQLIPGSQLAVLPDTTHMQLTRRADLLLPMLPRFLN